MSAEALTIAINPKYLDALSALGDTDTLVNEAVRRYTVEQIAAEVARYRRKNAKYEAMYGMPYDILCDKITAEDGFAQQLRMQHPSWEADLNAWEFYAKGLKTWLGRLESISKP